MRIGYKLKEKRDYKKLSQQEVADYLNVSQRTYSNFESDKTEPSITQLITLAKVLEFDLLDMLKEQLNLVEKKKDNTNYKPTDKNLIINQQKEIINLLKILTLKK